LGYLPETLSKLTIECLGFGIVAHILEHNPEKIYILSQKEHHADEAMEALKEYGDVSKVQWKQCNLENLEETRRVAENLKNELFRLDALVLNAGLGVGVFNLTEADGIGKLEHFLLPIHLSCRFI